MVVAKVSGVVHSVVERCQCGLALGSYQNTENIDRDANNTCEHETANQVWNAITVLLLSFEQAEDNTRNGKKRTDALDELADSDDSMRFGVSIGIPSE